MALSLMGLLFAVAIAALTSLLMLSWFRNGHERHKTKQPPGPRGLPLLGILGLSNHTTMYLKCMHWASVYGPIFSLRKGFANMVILNDWPSIKAFFSGEESVSHPQNFILSEIARGNEGIFSLNGEPWKANRRFCLSVLRNLGFGKTSMEEHIKDELMSLIKEITAAGGAAIPVQAFLLQSTSNVITALLFGTTYAPGDPKRKFIVEHIRTLTELANSSSLINTLPGWAIRMLQPFTRRAAIRKFRDALCNFVSQRVEEHRATLQDHVNRDFIDAYLKKIKEHENEPQSHFLERHLVGNAVDFYMAGASTTASFNYWMLVACAEYPNTVQSRIQREIDDVIGRDRQPSSEDRKQMHFTMATLWEVLRWRIHVPLRLVREVQQDILIDGYVVPKGTVVLSNMRAVHRDPTLWNRPDEFDPTRFLASDNSGLVKKPEYLLAFSLGKRMCPGEALGMVEMFLYLTSFLQKFNVLPEDGEVLAPSDSFAVTKEHPAAQKLRFVPR